jgi:signal transduction histidine kinase
LAILIYAFLKDRPANNPEKSVVAVIGLTVACALGLAAVLTWIVLAGGAYLPSIYVGSVTQQNHVGNLLNLFMWLWGAVALTVLLLRSRTVLDLWLMVTLCAWMPNFIVAAFVTAVRFSLGWYMGRCFALIASCTVLFVLLRETTVLYSRLANVVLLLRRERSNRLMSVDAATSSMAHELRQPLTAISASGSAALILVEKNPPALKQIQECLADIVESAHNAERVIASVRDVFKRRGSQRDEINIYDAVRQALSVAQTDVLASGVHVETELRDDLSPVMADRTQIQQVLSNLIKNALDAMNSRSGGIRRLRLVAAPEGPSSVVISIQDSGPGIVAENLERVFDPFFTTKADGMGLGLSICRTIVEDHGGVLRLARSDSRGSILEVVLPVSGSGIRANKERSPAGPRT